MYTQILKDDDIYSIIAGIFETKRNCEVIDIKDLKISKDEQARAKGRVMYKTNKGKFAEDITAVFEDFYCCIVSPNSVWITKKPYAEIMIDLLDEYEKGKAQNGHFTTFNMQCNNTGRKCVVW